MVTTGDEPLLLVMGLGGQLTAWPLEFVDRLVAKSFRVVRFDNRDSGLSTMMPAAAPTRRQILLSIIARRFAKSSYLLDDMADDAAAVLEHLGIARAHVMGILMVRTPDDAVDKGVEMFRFGS